MGVIHVAQLVITPARKVGFVYYYYYSTSRREGRRRGGREWATHVSNLASLREEGKHFLELEFGVQLVAEHGAQVALQLLQLALCGDTVAHGTVR